jgi:hypothetical protein
MFFDLPSDIIKKIYQFDPTYHEIYKRNLKFLQKEWSVKYINKLSGGWGWDITSSFGHIEEQSTYGFFLGGGDIYDSIAQSSIYGTKKGDMNFNTCNKVCHILNKEYPKFYHIPDHLDKGDIYGFDKHFFIREYSSISHKPRRAIDVYPREWKCFKDKMKKTYNI